MPAPVKLCVCGRPLPSAALRCDICNRNTLKKIVRWAAAAGAALGLICSQLPERYQAPCQAVAKITSLSCGGTP